MKENSEWLNDINQIRSMMERSSRFISLSGVSGIIAGTLALIGAAAAWFYLRLWLFPEYYDGVISSRGEFNRHYLTFFLADAFLVLAGSLGAAFYLTKKKAKRQGYSIWDKSAKRMLVNLFIPLIAGGLFCFALLYHGIIGLIAPATLVFYGLALLNGGKYTLDDIRYLGMTEIILGLVASFFPGYGLFFWAFGFGVMHIVYGAAMYLKYDRSS